MKASRKQRVTKHGATISVSMLIILGVVIWLAWDAYSSYEDLSAMHQRNRRVEHLEGSIVHLDELLTNAARMAAITGESSWEARYRQFSHKLDESIEEAKGLIAQDVRIAGAFQTEEAYNALAVMNDKAFELLGTGQAQQAKELLFSKKYEEQKLYYAQGMRQFHDAHLDSISLIRTRANSNHTVRWVVALVALTAVFALLLPVFLKFQVKPAEAFAREN